MNYLPQLATVAGVMFLGCISPGPDLVAITSHALVKRQAGLCVAVGVATSHMVWATLTIFGLAAILKNVAWLYNIVRVVGAVYLLYLGVKTLISLRHPASSEESSSTRPTPSPLSAYRRGLLVGLTNPKGAAFFGSLFITVLPEHAPFWVHAATLVIVAIVSSGWSCGMAILFSTRHIQSRYNQLRVPIQATMGSILIGLGTKLALDH